MDSTELARQAAASFHSNVRAAGHDPNNLFAFAVAVAESRGLVVEITAKGATMLRGGRAVYDPGFQLIIVEDAGTDFDKAFLVAHEIGHAELGDSAEEAIPEIDPARAAEASPIGMGRVVDYGRRQRREIQMDLFARELLMPREILRKAYLQGNQSAEAISKQLNAPFEVVAQQLFDALLLPSILIAKGDHKERKLNCEQRDAAAHRGVPYLLEAGPGTGKTQTLVARVEGLIADGVDPRRILLLTFSNKAAGEMAARIAVKNKAAAAAMWIGTFHAFGLDLIRRFHAEMGLSKDPRLMERTEAVDQLESIFPSLRLTHYQNLYDPTENIINILNAVSRAKDEVVDAERYGLLAEAMIANGKVDEGNAAAEVAKVYQRYEQIKRKHACVDFGDLVSLPVSLLESNASVRQHLQGEYDHVLVDEYQDVNRSSVRLLQSLKPDGNNLWVVGDARQSIYRFRGASSYNMKRFGVDDFKGGVRGRLKENYRSTPQIVEAFSTFASTMRAAGGDAKLEADRERGAYLPEFRSVKAKDEQVLAIAEAISECNSAGHACRDQAILCTGNDKLAEYGADLERLGIPVLFLGNLFERDEIKDVLSILSLLVDRRAMGLVRLACSPEFSMPLDDVGKIIAHLSDGSDSPRTWQTSLPSDVSPAGVAAIAKLSGVLQGFAESDAPWGILAIYLLDRSNHLRTWASSTSVSDRSRCIALWQFMNFVRAYASGQGKSITRLLDRIRKLVRLGEDKDLRQLPEAAAGIDAVRIMTVHGAKGLEFPVVHFPGMNSDTIPLPGKPPACRPPDGLIEGAPESFDDYFSDGQREEQECIFYVAFSRARDRMLFYNVSHNVKGAPRAETPFLSRIGPGLERKSVEPVITLPVAADDLPIQWRMNGGAQFTARQIGLYESCPRRFFYSHILQIGGRQTVTDFIRMHNAVRAVSTLITGPVGDAELTQMVSSEFKAQQLDVHEHAGSFHTVAVAMVRYFATTHHGMTSEKPTAITISFDEGELTIQPDHVLKDVKGQRYVRRLDTGHYDADDADTLESAAFMLAARKAFPDARLQRVYLADEETIEITSTPAKIENRRKKLGGHLGAIRAGTFPAKTSVYTCPRCPAFFICGCVPPGVLQKKI